MRELDTVFKTTMKMFIQYWRHASLLISIVEMLDKLLGGFNEFPEQIMGENRATATVPLHYTDTNQLLT